MVSADLNKKEIKSVCAQNEDDSGIGSLLNTPISIKSREKFLIKKVI
jgi:hypothetical protein